MTTAAYLSNRKRYSRPQAMLWAENSGTLSNGLYVPNGYEVGADIAGVPDPEMANSFLVLSDDNRSPIDFTPIRIEQRQRMINGRMRSYHVADKLEISLSWNMLPSRAYAKKPDFAVTKEAEITNIVSNTDLGKVTYTSAGHTIMVGDKITVIGANVTGWNVSNTLVTSVTSDTFTVDKLVSGTFIETLRPVAYTNYVATGSNKGMSNSPYIKSSLEYTTDGGAGGVELLDWYESHTGPFWVYLAYDKYTNFGSDDNAYTHLKQYNQIIEMYIADFNYTVERRTGELYDFWNISVKLEEV